MLSMDVMKLSIIVLNSMELHSRFPPVLTACSKVSAWWCRVMSIRNAPVTIRVVMNTVSMLKYTRNAAMTPARPLSKDPTSLLSTRRCDTRLKRPGSNVPILPTAPVDMSPLLKVRLRHITAALAVPKLLIFRTVVSRPPDFMTVLLQHEQVLPGLDASFIMCMPLVPVPLLLFIVHWEARSIALLMLMPNRPVTLLGSVILPELPGRLFLATPMGSTPPRVVAETTLLSMASLFPEMSMLALIEVWMLLIFLTLVTRLRRKLLIASEHVLPSLPLSRLESPTSIVQPVPLNTVASRCARELPTVPLNRKASVTNVALTTTVTFVGTSTCPAPCTSPKATDYTADLAFPPERPHSVPSGNALWKLYLPRWFYAFLLVAYLLGSSLVRPCLL